jgi:type IV secretory pathway VirB4 component
MNSKDSALTENWIQVKDINNGMIFLEDGNIVSGVKISPRNIFILTENEQGRIINALKDFYNLIDYEFWLVVADRPVDINLYVSQLELQLSNEQRPGIRKLLVDDIEKAEMFALNNVVDTEYYFLVKDKDSESLTKKVRGIINNMAGTGLIATQTSNEDLRSVLDNFLNGGVTYNSGSVITE